MTSEHMTKIGAFLAICVSGLAGYQWARKGYENDKISALEKRLNLAWDEILKLREQHGVREQS